MFSNKIKVFLLTSICLIFFFVTYLDVKSSEIKVVDGDTIHLNNEKIRFSGIDTPEIEQICNKNNEVIEYSITSLFLLQICSISGVSIPLKRIFSLFKCIVSPSTTFISLDFTSRYVTKKNIRQILVSKKTFILFENIIQKIPNKHKNCNSHKPICY